MLSVDGPVKQRLDTLAGELAKAADKELQVRWDLNRMSFLGPGGPAFAGIRQQNEG